MPNLTKNEFRLTQLATPQTRAAGVANTRTNIAEFTVPIATSYVLRPSDIFSMLLQDTVPTGLAATSRVELIHTDPNSIVTKTLVDVTYTALTEFRDRQLLYALGQTEILREYDLLRIFVTGNLAAATANTSYQISCLRVAKTIPV